MTTRPQGYGLTRELAEKNAAKYSVDDEVPTRIDHFLKSRKKFSDFRGYFWNFGKKRESEKLIFLCKKLEKSELCPQICFNICQLGVENTSESGLLQVEIVQWICDVTGLAAPAAQGPDGFRDFLRSGVVLCTLMNALKEGCCRKPHDTSKTKLAVSSSFDFPWAWELRFFLNRRCDKTKKTKTSHFSWALPRRTAATRATFSRLKWPLFI